MIGISDLIGGKMRGVGVAMGSGNAGPTTLCWADNTNL